MASRILSVMHATPSVFLMTSFLFFSFSETPSIHRSILISILSSSPSSLLVTDQVSAPYISTGLNETNIYKSNMLRTDTLLNWNNS